MNVLAMSINATPPFEVCQNPRGMELQGDSNRRRGASITLYRWIFLLIQKVNISEGNFQISTSVMKFEISVF